MNNSLNISKFTLYLVCIIRYFLIPLKYFIFFFVTSFIVLNRIIKYKYVTIFIVSHKDFHPFIKGDSYKIVTDDNNSLKLNYKLEVIYSQKKNPFYPKRIAYGEVSKIYYIFKYYRPLPKYIGFNHYRRCFNFGDNIPNLEKIFKNYDVILDQAWITEPGNIMQQFKREHYGPALDDVMKIIKKLKPEYYETAIKTMNLTKLHLAHLFIMKKEDFLKWGEFIYPIMFEYDKIHGLKTDSDVKNFILKNWVNATENILYQRRLQGFLSERISNVFYNYQFKKKYEINFTNFDLISFSQSDDFKKSKDINRKTK